MLRRMSIRTQFIVITFVSLLLVTAGVTHVHLVRARRSLIEGERARGQALIASVNLVIQSAPEGTASFDDIPALLPRLGNLVEQNEGIDFIAVTAPNGYVLAHSDESYVGQTLDALAHPAQDESPHVKVGDFGSVYLTSAHYNSPVQQEPGEYYVLVGAAAERIDNARLEGALISGGLGVGMALLIGALTYLYVQSIVVRPVAALTAGAHALSQGDFSHRFQPAGGAELTALAHTLNTMATELQESRAQIEDVNRLLEQRVNERTRQLATVSEVSARMATMLDVSELLQAISDLTKENFDLYHAHIYLLDRDGQTLTLAAGAGSVGRQLVSQGHRIPLMAQQSLVARAARTRRVVVQNNVQLAPDFLPNPLLPHTQSELAVALEARGQLLGVLDVQSDQRDRFGDDMQMIMAALAQQIGIALSNAQLFSEVERGSRYEHTISAINDGIQGAVSMDEVLEIATRELGKALRVPHTTIELQVKPEPEQVGH